MNQPINPTYSSRYVLPKPADRMPSAHIAFPKWEEVLSGLIEQYRLQIDLPDSLFEDAHTLIKKVGRQKGKFTFSSAKHEILQEDGSIPESLIKTLRENDSIEQNQFFTLSLSDIDIKWVDERVTSALGINQESFTEEGLHDWQHGSILYHPMDALHVLRYAILKDHICQLNGIIAPDQEYSFSLRFRMVKRRGPDGDTLEFKLIDKRRAYVFHRSSDNDPRRFYLNLWTVSDDYERHKVVEPSIEVYSDAQRTRFLNTLLYLFNAKCLGFSPKDVLVTNYNNLYDGPEESRASLNRALRKYHDDRYEFAVKPYTDCSYYLNKKLTTSLERHSLDRAYKSSFYVRMNRLGKAMRLGLTPIPRELREIILAKVFMPSL